MLLLLTFISAAAASCAGSDPAAPNATLSNCKVFPGDSSWPSVTEWSNLNETVGGRLVKTVPLGSPCHDPDYDEALCKELQDEWIWEPVQYVDLAVLCPQTVDNSIAVSTLPRRSWLLSLPTKAVTLGNRPPDPAS